MNVLDEILDNHVDEDIDAEFKNDYRPKKHRPQQEVANINNNNNNKSTKLKDADGNGRRVVSPCSQYSSQASPSRSCSCDTRSSRSRSNSRHSSEPQTRSPTLKIKISTASDTRIVNDNHLVDDRQLKNRKDHKLERKSRRLSSKKRDYRSLIKYFFKDSCFFLMKSNNPENVDISKKEGVWSTPSQNESKLNKAFLEYRNVILIFSVKESGRFQGFARLASEADYDCAAVSWVLPPGVSACPFGGVFHLDWICKNELSFNHTSHLYNPFNDNRPVKIARDGQEIEPRIGEELCRLFPSDDSSDLIPMLKRMKKQTANRPKKISRNHLGEYDHRLSWSAKSNDRDYSQHLSRKRYPSDHYDERMAHSYRHSRDDRIDRNRLYSHRSSRHDVHGYAGNINLHTSRRSPPYSSESYHESSRRLPSRYDRRY